MWTDDLPLTVLDLGFVPETPWRHDEPALTLRGALGASLVALACTEREVACRTCPSAPRCLVPGWYDPGLGGGAGGRPFWLRATSHARGVSARWTFLGPLPDPGLVVDAARRAAALGLGADRIPCRLTLRAWNGRTFVRTERPEAVAATTLLPFVPEGDLLVRTRSRLRLERDRRVLRRPLVSDLLFATVLRVRELERRLGARLAPLWPTPAVDLAPTTARWVTGGRWSRRQEESVDLSGVEAAWRVPRADLGDWLDLLRLAEVLQLGTSTSAGLGVLAISPANP